MQSVPTVLIISHQIMESCHKTLWAYFSQCVAQFNTLRPHYTLDKCICGFVILWLLSLYSMTIVHHPLEVTHYTVQLF